jgi:hypothetical protein
VHEKEDVQTSLSDLRSDILGGENTCRNSDGQLWVVRRERERNGAEAGSFFAIQHKSQSVSPLGHVFCFLRSFE